MAKEASVAPRERVNIVYRPATGDAQEEVELPLKLLVMGDFTGKPDDRPLEEREPINIDKDNFNEVLKAQGIGLNITVPNKISGEPDDEMSVELNFESIKDFNPEEIAKKVPELNKLLELREALTALKGPLSNIPAFRKKIQELVKDEAAREKLLKELGLEK
ncbi:MAG: type VI secretion system contractile sheath small subunit [Deltaproteobacteria bacterium]|nr:MAG: type VI secretion system contractile sheath small subunit [Deltaproteobacteria bacterium]RLB84310.1 MAG: type VI secretion system contractile sheath small subunit [Deltaproteobacteria bacterium]